MKNPPRPPFARASGVLLHVTSLPGGRLGDEARRFVDWLADAGQRWWQVLPLGPPGVHGSPYSSPSAFAGSTTLLARPAARVTADDIEEFVAAHPYWVADWAGFAGPGAIADQVRFSREWAALRRHAADRGVAILGDLPIYVAQGGADVQSHPELFRHDEVAGVPPDDWAVNGQRWGNPLYDWRAMRVDRYRWWVERLRRMEELVDATRIDHFRGFVAYWAIPRHHRTARHGQWRRAPGAELLERVTAELGPGPLVAEDLGIITPAVDHLRRRFGIPGCVVMQFRFTSSTRRRHRETTGEDVVAYTATHDNDTTVGWWSTLPAGTRRQVDAALADHGISEERPHWKLMRLAWESEARVAIVPAQDLLGLGTEARMNRPGRARGNWRWQLGRGLLDRNLAAELCDLTEATSRTGLRHG